MLANLADIHEKMSALERQLAEPNLMQDQKKYQALMRDHARVAKLCGLHDKYLKVGQDLAGSRELIRNAEDDPELAELAKAEIEGLTERQAELEREIRLLLLPPDPNDSKNIFLEIRAGTGGDEAALFVSDLFRMYSRFAESQGWKTEIMSSNPIGIGGFKELIALISGHRVYSKLKYESGAHRV
jgi:peptide chain release factor 1